eukprot:6177527-Pleurochrysis_carterae.AAC.1
MFARTAFSRKAAMRMQACKSQTGIWKGEERLSTQAHQTQKNVKGSRRYALLQSMMPRLSLDWSPPAKGNDCHEHDLHRQHSTDGCPTGHG